MLDIRFIRDNAEAVRENTRRKGYEVNIDELLRLDSSRRELMQTVERIRNDIKKHAAMFRETKGTTSDENKEKGKALKAELAEKDAELKEIEAPFLELLKKVPNMALDDVPLGATEGDNIIAKKVGEPTTFDFKVKNHAEIAEAHKWLDKERAAKVASARFAYIMGDMVKLHFAVVQFAMNILTDETKLTEIAGQAGLTGKVSTKPFTLVMPPLMIRTEPYDAMDRLEPRDDRYKIEGEELWLQGSAEHVLGSMHIDEILLEAELPVRYVGYATSFRREAGTYGKDMEGIFRMHQFEKLEMESLTTAETALDEHLFMIAIQEYLMQQLRLPYQVIMKCTADIGKPNARGVDIDTWLPGQGKYRETHTADYMTDYQARRLRTRVRRESGNLELVHTNDATVFSQRPLIAIIENNQQADGSVIIPEVLRPYMGGREVM
jgi:seryl-tRNA synthetase